MKKPAKKAVKKSAPKKEKTFKTYTDIKSYADACAVMKYNPAHLPIVTNLPKSERRATVDAYKLRVVIAAINKLSNWKPDYSDFNQGKYYPWFEVKTNKKNPSGFAFSGTDTHCDYSLTVVGPRLSVGTRDEALYVGTKFADLYKGMFF